MSTNKVDPDTNRELITQLQEEVRKLKKEVKQAKMEIIRNQRIVTNNRI